MNRINPETGTAKIGQNSVTFEQRTFQGKYSIWVPREFLEDKSLISNYTYLYSQDNSPLSIAIRYTPVSSVEDRKKMVSHHFSRGGDGSPPSSLSSRVFYRDTLAKGREMSVYSLRFSVEVDDGLLFGCFNCAGGDLEDWKPIVLEMLDGVTSVKKE